MLELAHQLGLRAVAEGVEDDATAARLGGYGFDLLQGWAFSKALPEVGARRLRLPGAARRATGPIPAPTEPAAPAVAEPITRHG